MAPEAMATSKVVHLGIKNKELTSGEQMKAAALLIGRVKDGALLHGSIFIVNNKFSIACAAMSHLWDHTCLA